MYICCMDIENEGGVLSAIEQRWSPYAFDGSAVSQQEMDVLVDAARRAPSAFNNQSARFLTAHRGTPEFEAIRATMIEWNQMWTADAGVLIVALGRDRYAYNDAPNPLAQLEVGFASQNLMTQATSMGLHVHPLSGFDASELADKALAPGYTPYFIMAVGRQRLDGEDDLIAKDQDRTWSRLPIHVVAQPFGTELSEA